MQIYWNYDFGLFVAGNMRVNMFCQKGGTHETAVV
jgi:hypothetical protein